MKTLIGACLLVICQNVYSQETRNIFIITTDGFRWQEVFNGADSAIINDPRFVKDTALLKEMYWDNDANERRKKLMPFFWNTIAKGGQLYGNRSFNNKVNVKNLYKISYPGYNELFTGYADPLRMLNTSTYNKNISVLEYLDKQSGYEGKVVAFSSWDVFPYILNKKRNKIFHNSGYDINTNTNEECTVTKVQKGISNKTNTRQDLLTYITAKDYIQANHPRVVLISLGQTDEYAHLGQYDMYLQQANSVDKMIAELWYYVQTDPFYKDQTTFIITTDHGRGAKPCNWAKHNMLIKGSGQTWLALLGQNIEPIGEMTIAQKIFQQQVASTIAGLLGEKFEANHPVAKELKLPAVSTTANAIAIAKDLAL